MSRPNFEDIQSGAEFNQWYWLKVEMVDICKAIGLPTHGRKFDLRDRIMYALDNEGALLPEPKKKPTSNFKWSKATLTPETVMTDNITFGQNLRRFMKAQVGEQFSFHTDLMEWMKANTGKTLKNAVAQWHVFEQARKSSDFRTDIAANNMYNQYTRDFLDANPSLSPRDVRRCWNRKRRLPMKDGFVRYEKEDLRFLEEE
jgi:hypothetical protein